MPTDKEIEEFVKSTQPELTKNVNRRIMPRGPGDPVLERAINRMRLSGKFPRELASADIQPIPISDKLSGTNIAGQTSVNRKGNLDTRVEVNPLNTITQPQYVTDEILGHELTHVGQFIGTSGKYDDSGLPRDILEQFARDTIAARPNDLQNELQARIQAKKYLNSIPQSNRDTEYNNWIRHRVGIHDQFQDSMFGDPTTRFLDSLPKPRSERFKLQIEPQDPYEGVNPVGSSTDTVITDYAPKIKKYKEFLPKKKLEIE